MGYKISSRITKKFENGPRGIIRGSVKKIHEKLTLKIS
jgi:hypothetical protein